MRIWTVLLLLLLLKGDDITVYCGSGYLVGLGSYDITGPAADVNLMGYAKIEQVASGVHLRYLKTRLMKTWPQTQQFMRMVKKKDEFCRMQMLLL